MDAGNAAALRTTAATMLERPESDILAAGVFGMENLGVAQAGGVVAGAAAAEVVTGNPLADALGAALGSWMGRHAAAQAQGVSVQLIVAVTDQDIYVLSERTDAPAVVAQFPRTETEVVVSRRGASRILRLTHGGHHLDLHGTAAGFRPQSGPDADVFSLIAPTD